MTTSNDWCRAGALLLCLAGGATAMAEPSVPETGNAVLLASSAAGSRPEPVTAGSEPRTASHAAWTPTGTDEGILTFKRDVPGSPIIALRGEGLIDAPIQRVASVVLDNHRAPEWVDSVEEVRLVRMLGAAEFIEYDHVGAPPFILDRDFVCRGKIEVDAAAQTMTIVLEPATDPAVPPFPKKVRGTMSAYWQLKSVAGGSKTYVIAEIDGDPKGSIPKWLVNFFQKGWPHNTLKSLRKQVAKPDIRIIPQVKAVFEGKSLLANSAP